MSRSSGHVSCAAVVMEIDEQVSAAKFEVTLRGQGGPRRGDLGRGRRRPLRGPGSDLGEHVIRGLIRGAKWSLWRPTGNWWVLPVKHIGRRVAPDRDIDHGLPHAGNLATEPGRAPPVRPHHDATTTRTGPTVHAERDSGTTPRTVVAHHAPPIMPGASMPVPIRRQRQPARTGLRPQPSS